MPYFLHNPVERGVLVGNLVRNDSVKKELVGANNRFDCWLQGVNPTDLETRGRSSMWSREM